MDLNTAANELYVVAPSGFVQRRNELAAEAQRSGDKETAAAIKRLRKPTLGAWLANLLVHECNDEIDALLHLGETLRHAQVNPTGSELRRLAEQRRRVVAALVSEARALAGKAGQAAPDGAARELETTLSAVLADDEAAAKFRSGRLTSALEYSGFGPLDHVSGRDSPDDEHSPAKKSGKKGARPTRGRLWRRRETVEQLRVAQKAASGAAEALKKQEVEVARLERERGERLANVGALEEQLDKAKRAASASEDDLRQGQKALREAEGALRNARDRITQAETELNGLRDQHGG